MRTTISCFIIVALFGYSFLASCNKKTSDQTPEPIDPVTEVLNLSVTPFNYSNIVLPAHMNTPAVNGQSNVPAENAITDNGATLGRVLFYDKNLSINNSISCASCHHQSQGFADPTQRSAGVSGTTNRNSMSLINARYYPDGRFFWDQRASSLEAQTLIPIQDLVEMGMTLDLLETRLRSLAYYPTLFRRAFGDEQINRERIARALSQFIRSIVSFQSRYDEGRRNFAAGPIPPNAVFTNFTLQENRGKEIFLSPIGGCAPCHGSETFTALEARNNGLDAVTTDRGFGAVISNTALDGAFKVTSLRNVELTAPYMHDGRFATLEQVVEHYNSGVKDHPNLAPQLRLPNGQPRLTNLNNQDKAALVAFLKTLTDPSIATEIKYSNPFK